MAKNFGMQLDGAARKWFLCLGAPLVLQDTPAVAAAPWLVTVPGTDGLRTRFLRAFQSQHYNRYLSGKVTTTEARDRKIKSRVEYFYDVIDLCRRVDPAAHGSVGVGYLTRMGHERVGTNLPPPKEEVGTELRDLVLELKAEIAEAEKGPDQKKATPKEDGKGGQRSDRRDEGENRGRNDRRKEERKAWQARRRNCEEDDRNTVGMVSADEDGSGEAAVLLIDSSCLKALGHVISGGGVRKKPVVAPSARLMFHLGLANKLYIWAIGGGVIQLLKKQQ
ncbi:hypothetical protein OUZ56_016479 [Daphnia magna]|uniref:Uncharacterized protein n=1 Tax=Daphnia magna TaxID=35525 RepID=A0ABR0AR19_9CRUS|nr:hypothetical protein OUZ56_016479 [Daphnia magna]